MKKNYMRPESMVVKIETAPMLNGGSPDVTVNTEGSVNANAVDSRDFDDWDE